MCKVSHFITACWLDSDNSEWLCGERWNCTCCCATERLCSLARVQHWRLVGLCGPRSWSHVCTSVSLLPGTHFVLPDVYSELRSGELHDLRSPNIWMIRSRRQMGRACCTYGGEQRCIQGYGGEA